MMACPGPAVALWRSVVIVGVQFVGLVVSTHGAVHRYARVTRIAAVLLIVAGLRALMQDWFRTLLVVPSVSSGER